MVWQNSNAFTLVSLAQSGGISGGGGTLPSGGGSVTLVSLVDVSQYQSYDLAMNVYNTSQTTVAGVPETFDINLLWFDDLTSGIPVFTETWHPWVLNTTVALNGVPSLVGTGPMHGHYLTITANGPAAATASATVQYFNLFGSPRNVAVSDWRQASFGRIKDPTVTAIRTTLGDYNGYDNVLATTAGAFNVTASTSYYMPLALYAGPARISLQYIGATTIQNAEVCDIGSSNTPTGSLNNTSGKLVTFGTTTGSTSELNFILPRSACALFVTIGTTGGQVAVYCAGQQGP